MKKETVNLRSIKAGDKLIHADGAFYVAKFVGEDGILFDKFETWQAVKPFDKKEVYAKFDSGLKLLLDSDGEALIRNLEEKLKELHTYCDSRLDEYHESLVRVASLEKQLTELKERRYEES